MAAPRTCPCDLQRPYDACCGPFHRLQAWPPDPPTLMRSRYSAFALKQTDHLVRTLHPDHEDARRPRALLVAELKRTINRLTYVGLTVHHSEPEDQGGNAFVTVTAQLRDGTRDVGFTERSRFRRHDGTWRYLDGQPVTPPRAS